MGETRGRLLEEMVVSSCHCGDSGLFVAAIAQTYARDTATTCCFALASLLVGCRGLLASRVARACAAWAHINPATTSGGSSSSLRSLCLLFLWGSGWFWGWQGPDVPMTRRGAPVEVVFGVPVARGPGARKLLMIGG